MMILEIYMSRLNPRVPDWSSYRRRCGKLEITCSRQVCELFLVEEKTLSSPRYQMLFLVNNVFHLLYLLL